MNEYIYAPVFEPPPPEDPCDLAPDVKRVIVIDMDVTDNVPPAPTPPTPTATRQPNSLHFIRQQAGNNDSWPAVGALFCPNQKVIPKEFLL